MALYYVWMRRERREGKKKGENSNSMLKRGGLAGGETAPRTQDSIDSFEQTGRVLAEAGQMRLIDDEDADLVLFVCG